MKVRPMVPGRFVPVLAVLVCGCPATTLDGEVDGRELGGWGSAVYWEMRGTEPSSGVDIHPIDLWLLPMEDGCTAVPALLDALASIRGELDDGLDTESYCDAWEGAVFDSIGEDDFWVARFRLQAQPRLGTETPEREYPYFDEEGGLPDAPYWDGELLFHPAGTFDACAAEFAGDGAYAATTHGGSGGTVTVAEWAADEHLEGQLAPEFEGSAGALSGRFDAEFCLASEQWPVDFLRPPG